MSKPFGQMAEPFVSIIIVTWNCCEKILQCLRTIHESRSARFEIIVRDNGSTDGTAEAIQKNYPNVKLLGNGQNIGFAAANNEAIKQAAAPYLLLLNPDTEITSETIISMIKTARSHDDRVMVVPTLLNADGTLQPARHSFPTLSGLVRKGFTEGKKLLKSHTKPNIEVDWAIGACWLIPAAIYKTVGELDANLFMYGEDIDYCWRVHRAGFKIVWAPEVRIIHHGNISGLQKWGDQRLAKTNEALIYFWMKHFGPHYLLMMVPVRIMYYLWQAVKNFFKAPADARQQLRNAAALLRSCLNRNAWRFYLSAWKRRK